MAQRSPTCGPYNATTGCKFLLALRNTRPGLCQKLKKFHCSPYSSTSRLSFKIRILGIRSLKSPQTDSVMSCCVTNSHNVAVIRLWFLDTCCERRGIFRSWSSCLREYFTRVPVLCSHHYSSFKIPFWTLNKLFSFNDCVRFPAALRISLSSSFPTASVFLSLFMYVERDYRLCNKWSLKYSLHGWTFRFSLDAATKNRDFKFSMLLFSSVAVLTINPLVLNLRREQNSYEAMCLLLIPWHRT